jgi:DNA-binding CsgD family transcriptional regulator
VEGIGAFTYHKIGVCRRSRFVDKMAVATDKIGINMISLDQNNLAPNAPHEPYAVDQLLGQLLKLPKDFPSLQRKTVTSLRDMFEASAGVGYLSRNDRQGCEARSFVSTSDDFGCGNDCHGCISRIAAAACDGELVRSATRYASPVSGGSVVTRFGVGQAGMPRCVGADKCQGPSTEELNAAFIYSLFYLPKPEYVAVGAISLYRQNGMAHPFTRDDCNIVNELHSRLTWLYELGLQNGEATEPTLVPLQPRLLKVLEQLLPGYSEKQVAVRLGYSPHTVHTYVKAIYKHFAVTSRSELLAKLLGAR